LESQTFVRSKATSERQCGGLYVRASFETSFESLRALFYW
jgi:hypothetical protein